MSNLFNISVKPEIAAAVGKIDANTALLDLIRGTDVVNLASAIANNNTVVDLIRGTDVVNLASAIANNNTILTDLHDTDIPALLTNLRGQFKVAYNHMGSTSWATVLEISGSGLLRAINLFLEATKTYELRITIDGIESTLSEAFTANDIVWIIPGGRSTGGAGYDLDYRVSSTNPYNLDIEFLNTLKVEARVTEIIFYIDTYVYYTLD